MNPHQLWWQHARVPLAVFIPLAFFFATDQGDVAIARAVFFDSSNMQWVGAGNWWVNAFIHVGGRWLIRGIVAAALSLWIATFVGSHLRGLRRPAAYFLLATVLSIGVTGLLKTITNVDCPWDLSVFGGRFPFVKLFADRPDALRHAHCFPAAHASTGYALLALYFVFRDGSTLIARLGLGLGIGAGLVFGIAQQARGAHFVSHDLWSAFLVWMISLTIYAFVFKARLWNFSQRRLSGYAGHEAPVAAGGMAVDGPVDVQGRIRGLAGTPRQ